MGLSKINLPNQNLSRQNLPRWPANAQTGFTLVDILFGLTVGILTAIVVMQTFSVFEKRTIAATKTSSAQASGSIALYNIARELQNAGYPLMPSDNSPLECTQFSYGATGINEIFPVSITDGVAIAGVKSASDSITIRYGDTHMGGIPTNIVAVDGDVISVDHNLGCQNAGEVALIVNGTSCAMSLVTSLSPPAIPPALENITLKETSEVAIAPEAEISCFGHWRETTYAVSIGNLVQDSYFSIAGIVNLQAQYGVSKTADSNHVDQWVDATGIWGAPISSPAIRNRIKAIRVALVVRTDKKELTNVTTACSSATDASPTGLCAWDDTSASPDTASPAPIIDLSDDNADWLKYHYRVFETILPLRNLIWAKDTL